MAEYGHLHKADIPYEQRVKYIIEDYKRIWANMDKATEHFRKVEEQYKEWQDKYYHIRTANDNLMKKCKNLKIQIELLSEKNRKLKAVLDKNGIDYENIEND